MKSKDWLDEFMEKEPPDLEEDTPKYFWHPIEEELYKCSATDGPQAWSVIDQKWVWDEDAAAVLFGLSFGRPIKASDVQKYIDNLEEKYRKTN